MFFKASFEILSMFAHYLIFMKYILLVVIYVLQSDLSAQNNDSVYFKKVMGLIEVSRSYRQQRDFDNSLKVLDEAEKLALAETGYQSEAFARCNFQRALVHYDKQEYKEAEKYFNQSMSIYEHIYGKMNSLYADCLKNLSNVFFDQGEYGKAEMHNVEEMKIREITVGKEHVEYISSINNLSSVYQAMGAYFMAEPLNLEAVSTSERVLGNSHPEYINSLNNLAILYYDMANYEKAEGIFIRLMNLRKEIFGEEHPEFSASLNNLALLYETMGNYSAAEPLYLQSREIIEKTLGKEHPDYVLSLANLANLYWHWADFNRSERYQLEAKAILEKTLGPEHPDYAHCLNSLGTLYQSLGNFEKAEECFVGSLRIREISLGRKHPDYAFGLYGLATLYKAKGDVQKSEKLYLDALVIMEEVFGKEHPNYALGLTNLAGLYADVGKNLEAEKLYREMMVVQEKALGKEHPDYVSNLNCLADLLAGMKRYDEAEIIYREVIQIRKKVLGPEHPDYAVSLKSQAMVFEKTDRLVESEKLLEEYFSIVNSNLNKSVSFLSEQELYNYVTLDKDADILGSFLCERLSGNRSAGMLPELFYNQALFQKGFLIQAVSSYKNRVVKDSEAAKVNDELKAYRRLLARAYTVPMNDRDSVLIDQLEDNANQAEKKLARMVAGYADAARQVKWQDVKNALVKISTANNITCAALEFVQFKMSKTGNRGDLAYGVLLIHPAWERPEFIYLFNQSKLDSILLQGRNLVERTNFLYATRGVVPDEKGQFFSIDLFNLIWKPVRDKLTGTSTVFVSSAGRLNQINLGAIPSDDDRVMSEKFKLFHLSSTRQLCTTEPFYSDAQGAVLFGGIQYELDSKAIQEVSDKVQNMDKNPMVTSGSLSYANASLRGTTWTYLPGTEQEISSVGKILQDNGFSTDVFRHFDATEEVFRKIGLNNSSSPRILHIATHGYFFPDPDTRSDPFGSDLTDPVFRQSDNPLIRSGLILAGGNHAWKTGKPWKEGMEDGILTAYEISQMDLSNTELVVLSACETGLGDIQGNEGVYGLQRAFRIAGVKYIIMSLWQVPDKQTSLLMTTFYKKWLEERLTIPDAFHAAQKQLRDSGLEAYYWAGFVLVE